MGTFEIRLNIFCIMLCLNMSPIHSCVEQVNGGHRMEFGSLIILGQGRGTIRRCCLIGVGVAMLEEMCHCGGRL